MTYNYNISSNTDQNNYGGTCDTCAYFEYDEEFEEYFCSVSMDEDDVARLMQGTSRGCPFYRDGDEYAIVRHQM